MNKLKKYIYHTRRNAVMEERPWGSTTFIKRRLFSLSLVMEACVVQLLTIIFLCLFVFLREIRI